MKSKLNKQQKKYIKACDCKELRKELKRFFRKENKYGKIKYEFVQSTNGKIGFPSETTNDNSLTKETLESLTNPDLVKKKKDFEDAIDKHLLSEDTIFSNNMLSKKHKHEKASLAETSQDTLDWMHQRVEYVENKTLEFDLPKTSQKIDELPNATKLTYSREDMFKCFYESRLTNPIVGFKFDSFASYIEYLQK